MQNTIAEYFKPETRAQGAELVASGIVSLAQTTDTQIRGFVRKTPPIGVTLMSTSIASDTFRATCACPVAKKGRLCKHIWATLLITEKNYPDFLVEKSAVELAVADSIDSETPRAAAYKAKQADYRKAQYQAQKERQKSYQNRRKLEHKSSGAKGSAHSDEVAGALKYFSDNGFPLEFPPDPLELIKAKRILSGVFHPDKGGAHEEMLELIRNVNILAR